MCFVKDITLRNITEISPPILIEVKRNNCTKHLQFTDLVPITTHLTDMTCPETVQIKPQTHTGTLHIFDQM